MDASDLAAERGASAPRVEDVEVEVTEHASKKGTKRKALHEGAMRARG